MNWSALGLFLSGVNKYSTAFGRTWLNFVFIYRLLVFVVAAQRVWSDESTGFVCNTTQIGCTNVCYDAIFPISHVRLWALQLIFVSCPSLIVSFPRTYRQKKDRPCATSHKGTHVYLNTKKKRQSLWWTYLVSLTFKAVIDVAFLHVLHHIYNRFDLPRVSKCSLEPCPNTVDCYIERPTEKKIFTIFMAVSSAVCIFICICEIFCVICCRCWTVHRKFVSQTEFSSQRFIRVDPTASIQEFKNNECVRKMQFPEKPKESKGRKCKPHTERQNSEL